MREKQFYSDSGSCCTWLPDPYIFAPGAASLENRGKGSVNSEHEIKPALSSQPKSEPDFDAICEPKSEADYKSDYVSKSEPESDICNESNLEADYKSGYDSEAEAESEANFECGAEDGQKCYPFESRSAPAAISMALNIKAEESSLSTHWDTILSHYSPSLVNTKKNQGTAEVEPAQQDAAGRSSAELQSTQPRLSALISSLHRVIRSSTGLASASPRVVKATSGRQAAAGTALASLPDSKPDCSNLCKPMQRLKKLALEVCPSCTHSHQQEEDAQPWSAAAAAVHSNQNQYAHLAQEVAPNHAHGPQQAVKISQLDVQVLAAGVGSSAKQPEKQSLSSRMPSLTKLALLKHRFPKGQQAGEQVQPEAMPVSTSTVSEQQQQQPPMPAMANDRVWCVSKLTSLFKPKKTASKQAPLVATGRLAAQSLQEAEAAELIPAVRQPDGVAQQMGQSPQLQVTTTAAAKPAIQLNIVQILIFYIVSDAVWQASVQTLMKMIFLISFGLSLTCACTACRIKHM